MPRNRIRVLLEAILNKAIVSKEDYQLLQELDPAASLYSHLEKNQKELVASLLPYSSAQLAQDIFAVAYAGSREPKFFVEFGATDGVSLSNTYLLEKYLGWSGILAEPAKVWHTSLIRNRSCSIDTRCVSRDTGKLVEFLEVANQNGAMPELSSIASHASNGDHASPLRTSNSIQYDVETISLSDLLDYYNAPTQIQFLSIDTEGSEFDILDAYDFSSRQILSICVEHNYVSRRRNDIYNLLLAKGYKRVLSNVSMFDDWYVLANP